MQSEACVRAANLVKIFEGTLRALDGVSTQISEGEIHAFLGPNGAGKTTLMRILTTQLKPTSGDAWVMGYHVVREAARVREVIGYVPQEFSVWNDLTGRENLLIYAKLYKVPSDKRERIIEDTLEFMGLREAANRLVKTYSGGMIRRLELAAALMVKPKVLFLDEPTIGLDPRARNLVWSRILDYKGEYEATVIFNTHYMDEAERYAERVTVMNRGKVIAVGSPSELIGFVGEGALLQVRVDGDVGKALQALSSLNGVAVVSSRNPLSIKVSDAQHELPQILRVLYGAGVSVGEVTIRNPTLEDVFLKLTGMTIEEAEALGYREAASMRRAIRRGG